MRASKLSSQSLIPSGKCGRDMRSVNPVPLSAETPESFWYMSPEVTEDPAKPCRLSDRPLLLLIVWLLCGTCRHMSTGCSHVPQAAKKRQNACTQQLPFIESCTMLDVMDGC